MEGDSIGTAVGHSTPAKLRRGIGFSLGFSFSFCSWLCLWFSFSFCSWLCLSFSLWFGFSLSLSKRGNQTQAATLALLLSQLQEDLLDPESPS